MVLSYKRISYAFLLGLCLPLCMQAVDGVASSRWYNPYRLVVKGAALVGHIIKPLARVVTWPVALVKAHPKKLGALAVVGVVAAACWASWKKIGEWRAERNRLQNDLDGATRQAEAIRARLRISNDNLQQARTELDEASQMIQTKKSSLLKIFQDKGALLEAQSPYFSGYVHLQQEQAQEQSRPKPATLSEQFNNLMENMGRLILARDTEFRVMREQEAAAVQASQARMQAECDQLGQENLALKARLERPSVSRDCQAEGVIVRNDQACQTDLEQDYARPIVASGLSGIDVAEGIGVPVRPLSPVITSSQIGALTESRLPEDLSAIRQVVQRQMGAAVESEAADGIRQKLRFAQLLGLPLATVASTSNSH